MDMTLIIGISSVIIMVILFFGIRFSYQKKFTKLVEELNFFKKEKEYYNESMMVLSDEYEILFANQSAKELFSLDKETETLGIIKNVKLQVGTAQPIDFFEVLKNKSKTTKTNFHIKDASIIISGQKKRVNIYIDKSKWNINQTITCIIDTDVVNESVDSHQTGSIDFFTELPSQFTALSDINTLVVNSQKGLDPFSLFLLGIDNFNKIQTTLGLNYSNKILKKMANYFLENPDSNIKVYRMESDKFLMVLQHVDDDKMAYKIARNLIVSIANYYKGNTNTRITVSIGMAIYPMHGVNAKNLINNAYITLDQAQKESESNIKLFSKEYQIIHKDETKMNEDIRRGLKQNEFILYYQPIFNLRNEDMIGAEALIRWKHPEYGLLAPDKFLDVAEKTGLIVDIGEHVFKKAIQDYMQWKKLNVKEFKVTLNLSLREMQVDKLIEKLHILFSNYSADPKNFNLDITEKAAMSNVEKSAVDFQLFKELGLSISLDNFGIGHFSVQDLQILPLSMLKIDRSLIFDLSSNLEHQKTVKAIVLLAHTLGLKVAAEGIETKNELSILRGLDCDHAQGYLFSKPLPASEFKTLLE